MTSNELESSKAQLLAAAKTLFAKKGFDATSVKEIADAAQLNVSLISYHFGGKKELYRACLEKWGKERLAFAQKLLQTPKNLDEFFLRLRLMIEEVVTKHMEDPDVCKIIHRESELDQPIIEDVFRNTFMRSFQTLVEFFSEAQERGFLKSDLDPLLAASIVFGSLFHFVKMDGVSERYFGVTLKNEEYRKKVVDHVFDLFLKGALKESPIGGIK